MTGSSEYDEPVAYAPLTIYVYPEGDHWVASTLGYDSVATAPQSKLAADGLVKALLVEGWIGPDKQQLVVRKLKSSKELEQVWIQENENQGRERITLKQVRSKSKA
jgi:hypothetical protein